MNVEQPVAVDVEAIAATAVGLYGAQQHVGELRDFLRYLDEQLGPEPRILEIGSDAGGTLFAWRALRPLAHVVAISLRDGPFSTRPAHVSTWGAELIDGDSHDVTTQYAAARALVAAPGSGGVDLVFVDGDHTTEGVRLDVNFAASILRPGGVLALHDISPHPRDPDIGVPIVWDELLSDSRFEGYAEFLAYPAIGWGGIGARRRGERVTNA